jgi:hypothetical protein
MPPRTCPLLTSTLPNKRYHLCSDGSWTQLITDPFGTNVETKTGAACVIVDDDRQVHASFQALNLYSSSSSRAFTQEYIGLLMGKMLQGELSDSTIYCDSQATLKAACNDTIQDPRYLFRTAVKCNPGECIWVRGHQDRFMTAEALSTPAYGNLVADKVAGGIKYSHTTIVPLSTIAEAVLLSNSWCLLQDGIPLLDEVKERLQLSTVTTYCKQKNVRANVDYYNPTALSDIIATNNSLTWAQQAAHVKLHLFKFADEDRNIVGDAATSREKCSCGCTNELSSWTTQCNIDSIKAVRETTLLAVQEELQAYPTLVNAILQYLTTPKGHLLWRGIWESTLKTTLMTVYESITVKHDSFFWKQQRKLLTKIVRLLMQGALQMRSITSGKGYLKGKEQVRSPMQRITSTQEAKRKRHDKANPPGTQKITKHFRPITAEHHGQQSIPDASASSSSSGTYASIVLTAADMSSSPVQLSHTTPLVSDPLRNLQASTELSPLVNTPALSTRSQTRTTTTVNTTSLGPPRSMSSNSNHASCASQTSVLFSQPEALDNPGQTPTQATPTSSTFSSTTMQNNMWQHPRKGASHKTVFHQRHKHRRDKNTAAADISVPCYTVKVRSDHNRYYVVLSYISPIRYPFGPDSATWYRYIGCGGIIVSGGVFGGDGV